VTYAPWGNAVCVTCRAVVPDGVACHGTVVALDGPARAVLVDAIWGPESERAAFARRAHVAKLRNAVWMGGGATAGIMVTLAIAPVALITASFAALVGSLAGSTAGRLFGRTSHASGYPAGAAPATVPPRFAAGRIGRSLGLVAPAGGAECAGWAIELRYVGGWGNHVMLRIGATAGMDLVVDGGATLRVPAGPLRLVHPLRQLDDLEAAELELMLRMIDPQRGATHEPFSPLPYNVVTEDTLHVGDRVEIYGVVEPEVVETGDRLYRDAPATILVPRGVIALRRL
jgi:hypothetical protein